MRGKQIKKAIICMGFILSIVLALTLWVMVLLYPKLFNETIGICLVLILCLIVLSTMVYATSVSLILIFAPDILNYES